MFYSYKNLFKIQWKIYSLDNKHPLPRPIPLDGLALFILLLLPARFLAIPVAAVFQQPLIGVTLIFDGLLTWVLLKYDPQGRPFLGFVYDFLCFLLRPHKRDFSGRPLQKKRKMVLWWESFDLEDYGGTDDLF